ncbi:hypothetical protein QR680_010255 [Steinernema hermaphroditum]|uniref:Transporter n=1 Tax=Steinernema hermaphroditum TaxID=289476 RepID=A0AA39MAW8_9BILA|nr:hypothetical protein QR680_010255 [Steinernema hermaphroditum]
MTAEDNRGQWNSDLQFILACVGYSVGLGNIWRFPMLAYENGGGAFLIPYLLCSFVVGFPILYLEMSLGQFARTGPATVFRKLAPAFQGIGWGQAITSLLVAVYYNVIVGWTLLYLFGIVTGRTYEWGSCENAFNSERCASDLHYESCWDGFGGNETESMFFYNGTCGVSAEFIHSLAESQKTSPSEEYFDSYILQRTPSMDEFGGLNLKAVIALAIAWILTALCLIKGVKWIGRIALFTATVPYVIICILFVRSVTLPGAEVGLDYYLYKPDFSTILNYQTWQRAATHVCYSLAIGFGGLLSLSSFNRRNHNCFRDALIITCADGFMSVFGGTAVFSVLGFMATTLNVDIQDVVRGGTGLAFVVYPEAMNRMPLPWLWAFLFFAMLFILGISSQFGLAEVTCTALYDQFPPLRPYKAHIVCVVSFFTFVAGLLLCTGSGIYYFELFNNYSASFALMLLIGLELILVMYIYKYSNYRKDIRSMLGYPRNRFTEILGPSGAYIGFIWMIVAPLQAFTICGFVLAEVITSNDSYSGYEFPGWSKAIVWVLSSLSIVIFVFVGALNAFQSLRRGNGWRSLFQVQLDWPDRDDISRQLGTSRTSLDEGYGRYSNVVSPKEAKPHLNIVWVGDEKEHTKL